MSKSLIQSERLRYAKFELESRGIDIHFENDSEIRFMHKDEEVKFYPYTGWHTGKSIKDGRGIAKLLKQLRNANNPEPYPENKRRS